MGVKGFIEGGIASIVAGGSTHPLDLIKVRMQLQGESAAAAAPQPALRPALAFHAGGHAVTLPHPHHHHDIPVAPPRKPGPLAVGAQILRSEGAAGLFSGVSATMLRQTHPAGLGGVGSRAPSFSVLPSRA